MCAAPTVAQTNAQLDFPRQSVQRTEADLAAIAVLDSVVPADATLDSRVVHVQIPLTINVGITPFAHCSEWLAAGRPITNIVAMDLKTYIKNVLPNEWPNAWHSESLKAGAVAAKMFAWWRINLTETYAGIRPPGVHVVDNTCDQVYFANSHRPTTNAAIDATWPIRMTDAERVVEIHYLAHDYQCADALASYGGGWNRCMGQHGSRTLAEGGMGYQDILQTYYAPMQFSVTSAMPQKKNVLLNPKFDLGMQSWFTQGGVAAGYGITNGVFKFHRATGSAEPASVFQDANVIVSANSPLKFTVNLGNPSGVAKTVRLRIRAIETATSSTECTFTLAAGAPLLAYSVVGVNPTGWVGARVVISVMNADGLDGVTVDNAVLKLVPTINTGIPCISPRPGKPIMTTPVNGQAVRSPFIISLTEGTTNYVAGYSPSWQVQVDNNSDFSSPLYDNAAFLSIETDISVAATAGIWYVRARQYDGVGSFSAWTPKVQISVSQLPAAPVQLAPIGDAVAGGQSFVWQTSNLATKYNLVVKDATGVVIFKQAKTPVDWGCTADSCAVALDSLGVSFATGVPYSWRTVAINPSGKGMGKFKSFTLIEVARAPLTGFRH
jgi:hypothetical protein